jgi:hypothetical protein
VRAKRSATLGHFRVAESTSEVASLGRGASVCGEALLPFQLHQRGM